MSIFLARAPTHSPPPATSPKRRAPYAQRQDTVSVLWRRRTPFSTAAEGSWTTRSCRGQVMHKAAVIPLTTPGSVNWRQGWRSVFPGQSALSGDSPVAVLRLGYSSPSPFSPCDTSPTSLGTSPLPRWTAKVRLKAVNGSMSNTVRGGGTTGELMLRSKSMNSCTTCGSRR